MIMQWPRTRSIGLLLLGVVATGPGCAGFRDQPCARTGALPFPGVSTLYVTADPAELGPHVSGLCGCRRAKRDRPCRYDEVGRGIIYTRQAGFVDLAHVRNTIDWTYYLYQRVRPALADGCPTWKIHGCDRSVWFVHLNYQNRWQRLADAGGEALIDEAAIRLAQQLAYQMMSWHEIITAFGYASSGVIPETRSAFTWEDITSHALGIQIAGQAIRAGGCFDQTVTRLLDRRLSELEAVSPELTDAAVEMVRDRWWEPEHPLRYQYDIGLDSQCVRPWLVAAMSDVGADFGRPLPLASLEDVRGWNLTGLFDVALEPHVMEGAPIRRVLGGDVQRIVPAEHFPRIIDYLRQESRARLGPQADRP
jgi:hypothetical protein